MSRSARPRSASEHIDDLSALIPDPRNARSHSARNLDLIAQSLHEVGAARSIVVDEDGVVLAGNATITAAQQAGIARVRIIEADGSELIAVRRAGLTPEQKRRLALLDNRTAELAAWDGEVLASLAEDTDLSDLWEPDELAELLGAAPEVCFPEFDETAEEKSPPWSVPAVATVSPASYLDMLDAAWEAHLAPRATDAPTVVSLFAGGGGSSLGYSMAGYREPLAVEWDAPAVETLQLNFPDVPIWAGDIANLPIDECLRLTGLVPGELDVLDGSPPCQGFSTAGKRQLHDVRNSLWREYVRLLKGLRPRAFVLENVPGLVKGKMRLVFAECHRALKTCGYRVSARVLNASAFGVPQDRRRLVIVGVRDDLGTLPTHPSAQTWPIPLRIPLAAALLRSTLDEAQRDPVDWATPALDDVYGRLWARVPRGRCAADVVGKGYTNCVKPRLDRPCCTLPKTQAGRGFATDVHPTEPRALSVLEARLISSFPPQYRLTGSYRERWARIGNAVPPFLIQAIATHLRQTVFAGAAVNHHAA